MGRKRKIMTTTGRSFPSSLKGKTKTNRELIGLEQSMDAGELSRLAERARGQEGEWQGGRSNMGQE